MAKKKKKPVNRSRPIQQSASVSGSEVPSGVAESLAALLEESVFAADLPLPRTVDELLGRSSPSQMNAIRGAMAGAPPTLFDHYCSGYALLATDAQGDGLDSFPDWLRCTLDSLDVLFLGATWPGEIRSSAEFGNVRTAWLSEVETSGRGKEIAWIVAAALTASEDLQCGIDDPKAHLGAMTLLASRAREFRPLAAQLHPFKALGDARCVYGPPQGDLPSAPANADKKMEAFAAFLKIQVDGYPNTLEDALRSGIALLLSPIVTGGISPETLLLASGPMHVGTGEMLLYGTDEEVRSADFAEAETNAFFSHIENPVEIISVMSDGDVAAITAALPPPLVMGALYVGLNPNQSVGTLLRTSLAWALGLPQGSPAANVTDAIFNSWNNEEDASMFSRIIGMPELVRPLSETSVRYHAELRCDVARYAVMAGVKTVHLAEHRVVSVDATSAAMIRHQEKRFEQRWGRKPRPDEPIFFDHDADEPTEMNLDSFAESTDMLLKVAGVSELLRRVVRESDMFPPWPANASQKDMDDWAAAVDEAIEALDLPAEEANLQLTSDILNFSMSTSYQLVWTASLDEQVGANIVRDLRSHVPTPKNTALYRSPVEWLVVFLMDTTNAGMMEIPSSLSGQATQLARLWEGPELAAQVSNLLNELSGGRTREVTEKDCPALLCLMAAQMEGNAKPVEPLSQ